MACQFQSGHSIGVTGVLAPASLTIQYSNQPLFGVIGVSTVNPGFFLVDHVFFLILPSLFVAVAVRIAIF